MIQSWIDLLFPPLCAFCKEPCKTSLFCPTCWQACELPDPRSRCRHCFTEWEQDLCPQCKESPHLEFPHSFVFEATAPAQHLCRTATLDAPETLAAFAFVQWERLGWPLPDALIPLPNALPVARPLAALLDVPCFPLLRCYSENWRCDIEPLHEDGTFLLFSSGYSIEEISKSIDALLPACPKTLFVLSLCEEPSGERDP